MDPVLAGGYFFVQSKHEFVLQGYCTLFSVEGESDENAFALLY